MMPPHYDEVAPAPGEPIRDGLITFRGFSLRYAADPIVFDDTDGEKLEVALDLKVDRVGRGMAMASAPAGSIQEQSVMTLQLPPLPPGHDIRVEYLDETFRFKSG